VIQYFEVRYVFTKLSRFRTARRQERYLADIVQRRYRCETVRTVCRLPRIFRLREARNLRYHQFEDYVPALPEAQRAIFQSLVIGIRMVLVRVLAPKRVAGLGGLLQCGDWGEVGIDLAAIRHRNCLWSALSRSTHATKVK